MSRTKQISNRKHRSKAAPVLGAAGLSLTLASGLSAAAGPTSTTPTLNAERVKEITLREDEISDVSLATFHVFDKESQTGKRLACGCGGGCCLFARAPLSALGNEVHSTQSHRQSGRAHKHVPKNPKYAPQLQKRLLAMRAPSAIAANFAHTTSGSTAAWPTQVPNPQSLPAITFSRPTSLA